MWTFLRGSGRFFVSHGESIDEDGVGWGAELFSRIPSDSSVKRECSALGRGSFFPNFPALSSCLTGLNEHTGESLGGRQKKERTVLCQVFACLVEFSGVSVVRGKHG